MKMKIGLVRHFKVLKGLPEKRTLSPEELTQWFIDYDCSAVETTTTLLGDTEWKICYSSPMPRAITTAQTIYSGNIIENNDLREIDYPVFHEIWQGRLPFLVWAMLVRFSWYVKHRAYKETKADVHKRISSFLDYLEQQPEQEVLLVAHAALMFEFRKELRKRGFKGPQFRTAENGKLYVFENG
ncbi:histidine phosphatase family protein [Ammoniphilus sp. CFH 90114]|uniref:histidine phosphatase family protein n=1 Tax=Ammoniphilus sp. CFH 90114 TaxID=2493665 RepID=UPI001F0B73B7|nr:histidine phosphatase family protein [Ammoniphilus sp. CFH 90114]